MRSERRRAAPLRASRRGARGYSTGLSFGGPLAEGFRSQALLSRGEAVPPPSAVREDEKALPGATRSEHGLVLVWTRVVPCHLQLLIPAPRRPLPQRLCDSTALWSSHTLTPAQVVGDRGWVRGKCFGDCSVPGGLFFYLN